MLRDGLARDASSFRQTGHGHGSVLTETGDEQDPLGIAERREDRRGSSEPSCHGSTFSSEVFGDERELSFPASFVVGEGFGAPLEGNRLEA